MGSQQRSKVLLVGAGGVGTMAAYALEQGGQAEVTAVLRSNFDAVTRSGFSIDSIDHGQGIKGWRPSRVVSSVPSADASDPFDFIVVTTKNVPDISPTVVDIIAPAITPNVTTVCLMQNGLNIEKPVVARFPSNVVLSGVALIGATEITHGHIRHDDHDVLKIGPYASPKVPSRKGEQAAQRFVDIYNACGKVKCIFDEDVSYTRWRKLIYNSSFNSVATILRMDAIRMRMSQHIIDELIRPIMVEIQVIAKAAGVELADDLLKGMITADPIDAFFKPSMCQDIEKGNFIELENIVGEPLREAKKLGISAPMLNTVYGILKGLQLKTKEAKGLWKPAFTEGNPYAEKGSM